jgi:hypothetical protein
MFLLQISKLLRLTAEPLVGIAEFSGAVTIFYTIVDFVCGFIT